MAKIDKKELIKRYEAVKDNKKILVILYIHMPDGSTELIVNTEGHNKFQYINKTYDDNLVHMNSKDIYIVDAEFLVQKSGDDGISFGGALNQLKTGKRLTRKGWNGKGQYIYYVEKDGNARSYIAISMADGKVVSWVASQTDLLADDWIVYGE